MSDMSRGSIVNYEMGPTSKGERVALRALAAVHLGPHAVRIGRRQGIFGIQDPKIPAWQGEHSPDQVSTQEIDDVVAGQAPVSAAASIEAGSVVVGGVETGTVVYDPQQVMIARSEIDAFYEQDL